jgi:nucleolar protein 58
VNLAKQPGSTVQILGAEKALFRALKTKHATPKYGLIYHASLIGQAAPKHKGKISRSLAAKTALAIRYDALGDGQDNSMGLENRLKLEARLRNLEGRELGRSAGTAKGKPKIESYNKDHKKGAGALITAAKTYNPSADSVLGRIEAEAEKDEELAPQEPVVDEKKDKKKKKKEKKEKKDTADTEETGDGLNEDVGKKEKKKKKKTDASEEAVELVENVEAGEKKKKKRKHAEPEEEETETPSKKKDKKKKKKSQD